MYIFIRTDKMSLSMSILFPHQVVMNSFKELLYVDTVIYLTFGTAFTNVEIANT